MIFLVGLVALLMVVVGCGKSSTRVSTGAVVVDDVKEFNIIAKQFEFVPSTIRVKLGDTVRLIGTSADVVHGLTVPELNIHMFLEKGKESIVEFKATKKCNFPLICSVYCGSGHTNHRGLLIVE